MRRTVLLCLFVVCLATGCTRPPYTAPDKDLAMVGRDFTDCFSDASLAVNTPPFPDSPVPVRNQKTDACMKERGYQQHMWLF